MKLKKLMDKLLKRQKTQEQALLELEKKTSELLMRNAKNTANQAKITKKLASGRSIKIETLENVRKTIITGIDELQQIETDSDKKGKDDKLRLQAIKNDFNKKYPVPKKRKRKK
ncbi:MAG: hypothetical protein HDT22_02260 [Ruminococcus sp.]|nr:hypothetical protein [Ruminococcus sp.]